MNKHVKSRDIVYKYLVEHDCDIITREDCINICKLGKEEARKEKFSIWNDIENHSNAVPNRRIVVLIRYGIYKSVECIFDSDFDDFVKTHDCIAWATLKAVLGKKFKMVEYD